MLNTIGLPIFLLLLSICLFNGQIKILNSELTKMAAAEYAELRKRTAAFMLASSIFTFVLAWVALFFDTRGDFLVCMLCFAATLIWIIASGDPSRWIGKHVVFHQWWNKIFTISLVAFIFFLFLTVVYGGHLYRLSEIV